VDLVTLDAIVVDKDGHPVKGLKADDFVVTIQGQVRPVKLLDFREYGAGTTTEVSGRGDATNRPAPGVKQTRGGRVVVIVFDDLSFRPGPGKTLLAAAERTLSLFDSDDLIGITTTSGLGPFVNPTRDRGAIIAALHDRKMVGRYDDSSAPFDVKQQEALDIQRDFPHDTFVRVIVRECGSPDETTPCASQLRNTASALGEMTLRRMREQLTAYRDLIGTLARAPDTPRVIIALSNGVALGLDASEFAGSLEQVSRTAADSKVQFYALSDLVADDVDVRDQTFAAAQARRLEGRFLANGIQSTASAAGGEAFLVSGTADRFFKRIESETSGIYRLGVEPPAGSEGLRYLKTSVKVREPGVTVRAIRESVMPGVAAAADPERDVRTRLAEGGTSPGVPLIVGTEMRRDPTDASRIEMDVSVDVPATVKGPVTMMYGLVDGSGRIVESGRARATQEGQLDYRLAFPVRASAGTYRLRVVAADANGSIGSVEHAVSAALMRIGRYAISDLLTSVPAATGGSRFVALSAIPHDAPALTVSLELYPEGASGEGDLQVRFDLLRSGTEQPIASDPVTPSALGNARLASATLPVQSLAPGSYTIRATVFENGTLIGTESATFSAQ
jgi:VWFA-related protein